MLGAEILVEMLAAYGVNVVFGVPGDTNVPFYAALRRSAGLVSHIMARDERSAGFMADAYARVTGKPGVVEVPSGAGPMYALPAIAEANVSAVPLILITCDMPISMERRGIISAFDGARLFHSIVKDSYQVKSARQLPDAIRSAFRTATSGRPGAAHIVVADDLLAEDVPAELVSLHIEPECASAPSYRPYPAPEQVRAVLSRLAAARRPVIVAGGGAVRSCVGDRLARLAERLRIPVATTITGRTVLATDHPQAIGVVGDNGFHPPANRAVEQSDLIVYLGSKLGSVVTVGWTLPSELARRELIHVDIDPMVLGNNTRAALKICSDVDMLLRALLAERVEASPAHARWMAEVAGWRSTFWAHEARRPEAKSDRLHPADVMRLLNERLKPPVILAADAGTPTPYLSRYLALGPGSCIAIPRAFGGLGYAIPGVVGLAHARPGMRVVGLFGDGSLGMSAGELATLAPLDLPILLLHFNNSAFATIKRVQRLHGHNQTYSVDFPAMDGARIAQAFGLQAWRVSDVSSLEAALNEALACTGPCFIDLIVESIADTLPPMASWTRKLGYDPHSLEEPGRVPLAPRL